MYRQNGSVNLFLFSYGLLSKNRGQKSCDTVPLSHTKNNFVALLCSELETSFYFVWDDLQNSRQTCSSCGPQKLLENLDSRHEQCYGSRFRNRSESFWPDPDGLDFERIPTLFSHIVHRLNASNVHHKNVCNTKTIIFDKFFFRTFLLRHTNIYLVQSRTIFGFGRCEKSDPDL